MRYFYDTEFLERTSYNGQVSIDLISIGAVAENGREYYAVSQEMRWNAVMAHDWLRNNVVPHLPTCLSQDVGYRYPQDVLLLDHRHDDVKMIDVIREELLEFLTCDEGGPDSQPPTIELWAWYGAYDHVALCSLFGAMSKLPDAVPKYTCDLRQEIAIHWPNMRLPESTSDAEHHALADAQLLRDRFLYLQQQTRVGGIDTYFLTI